MLLHQRFIPGLAIASYIVGDEKSGEAAVIDPTRDVDEYIDYASEEACAASHIPDAINILRLQPPDLGRCVLPYDVRGDALMAGMALVMLMSMALIRKNLCDDEPPGRSRS